MRLKQPQFYRHAGMRQKEHLTRPRLVPIKKLELPFESVYQFYQDNQAIMGPNSQDPLISQVKGRVFIEHVTQLTSMEGGPRRTVLNPTVLANEYRRKNRLFKPLRKDQALTIAPHNLLVVNYAMLNPLYRYIVSYKANYFRWLNNARTFWDHVNDVHTRFGWNQYIEFQLPDRIPTLAQFRLMEAGPGQKTLSVFNTPAALNAFDFYQWLGENRDKSLMSALPDTALEKINFIFRARTHFFVVNLKQLDDWRKDPDVKGDVGYQSSYMQRRFLVLLEGLRDFVSGATQLDRQDKEGTGELAIGNEVEKKVLGEEADTPAVEPEAEPAEVERETALGDGEDLLPDFDMSLDDDLPPAPVKPSIDSRLAADDDDDDIPVAEEDSYPTLPNVELVEDETDVMEEIQKQTTEERLTQGVADRAWDLSELGLISPRAYQRAIEDANTYRTLPDPFGSGRTIGEQLEITAEDLALPEDNHFPDKDTVIDKSMLSSKLKDVNRKYVKDVLPKDILNSVLAIQQQGVSIKDYQIETVRDTMNHYQIHTVTIRPLRGRQSTVRFRLPVVDDDGRFISNGVTYRMRLQRADKPIRKIKPARVALTSYYNKTFVDRSQRTVNDYDRWLCGVISKQGLDTDDTSITDLRFGELNDTGLHLPRIYTLLAKRFRSFKAGQYEFFFDYPTRVEFFQKHLNLDVTGIETEMQVVVGVLNGKPVIVDSNNAFYLYTPDGLEVLGTLTDLLEIDTSKAPIEAAEMTVANKVLPVGFVLGYQFGLSETIRLLGAEVSRHQRGERLSTSADEYTLVFQDEVLVFSKHDYRAMLVLAGLNRFHRNLKQYSVWDFDKPDVYYRILEDNGLGIRYLREITALFQAWVDPITRGLLESMGEPTEYGLLLIRAVELLMTDYSPAEVDGAFMRYRGYERFAGAVYGELSRAVKTFNNRAGSGEHAVELNPHQVWQKVVQDPSVGAVEDSNPFANMREQEAMTYRGDGGRSGTSMVENTRIFHDSDKGVVSESTVDSGDVGVVAYLTPDANFTDLRGNTRPFDKQSDGPSKLLSSSALCAPTVEHDDMKRINEIVPLG
jgi:hypothetical protein